MTIVQIKRRGGLIVGLQTLKTMPSRCNYSPVSLMSYSQMHLLFFYLKLWFTQLHSQFFLQHPGLLYGSNLINFSHGLHLLFFCFPEKEEHKACGWLPPWPLPSGWDLDYHCPRNHVNFMEMYVGLDFCCLWFDYHLVKSRKCRLESPLTMASFSPVYLQNHLCPSFDCEDLVNKNTSLCLTLVVYINKACRNTY